MNPTASRHLSKVDPVLARVIRKVGPVNLVPPRGVSPYMSLVRAVAYQQVTGKAAATILGRVLALFPGKRFPSPEDLLGIPARKLRAAGLSGAKVLAMKDIAAKTLEGIIPSRRTLARMEDGEIIERLTVVRGVGTWTVEMLLISTLGRPDVWPATDFGVRKGISLLYRMKELPSLQATRDLGDRWRPHRSAAAWYLWRACDLASAKS